MGIASYCQRFCDIALSQKRQMDQKTAPFPSGALQGGGELAIMIQIPLQRKEAVSYTHLDVYKRQGQYVPDNLVHRQAALIPHQFHAVVDHRV